jgi:hypothetical protein
LVMAWSWLSLLRSGRESFTAGVGPQAEIWLATFREQPERRVREVSVSAA